nr:hypothetical protein [Tanacetum cinerariifolium]
MEDLKQQYLDELKCLSNLEYRNEIKIAELKENFNGMSIEIRKKEKLLQQEQWAYLSSHPSKHLNSYCYDDDEDYTSAITPNEPVLSTEEPDNSQSMRDEHLDTIPATESDEFIKSSVENFIPIPSESEGIPEHMCDVPSHDNSPPLDVSTDQIEDFSESNEEFSSIDDDSFSIDDIDYVGGIDDDILLTIKDDILREKLLNVNLLIAKIKALNANPTSSSDRKTKSSSTSLNSLLEETNTFDNSLPEFETFCFDVEEISSGSTTTPPDISLPEYEVFYDDHVKEISSGTPTTHFGSSLYASCIFDLSINPLPPADRSDSYEFTDELIPFISPPEYDCFLFKVEPNSRDFTKDVVEDISPTKEPHVHNALHTHPFLQLNMKFQPSSESLFTYVKEYQERDKIISKSDKNGKRGKAGKSQKQSQNLLFKLSLERSKSRECKDVADGLRAEVSRFVGSGVECLVRRLLSSDEFHATLARVTSLGIASGVERGLRMGHTNAKFEAVAQNVSNFSIGAEAKFNKAIAALPSTLFPFLGKVDPATEGALSDITQILPDKLVRSVAPVSTVPPVVSEALDQALVDHDFDDSPSVV